MVNPAIICTSHRSWVIYLQQISFLIIILLDVLVIPSVLGSFNPYEILGVRKDANQDQIKRAYRDLARRLHPDKSSLNEDEAGKRFIELNKAFEILKDPSRRSNFDHYGETGERRQQKVYNQPHRYHYNDRQAHSSDWAFSGGNFMFNFNPQNGNGRLKQKSITAKQYYDDYLKQSEKRPLLIFVYRDFCVSCFMIETSWMKMVDELAKHNIGFFSLNYDQEHKLGQELGVTSMPFIGCLINGKVHPYRNTEISLPSLVKFIKSVLPNNLITILPTEYDQERFIGSSSLRNRLSAIFLSNEKNLKLRYLLLANELTQYYRFGHISTRLSQYTSFYKKYNIVPNSGLHLLIFDERFNKPKEHIKLKNDEKDISQVRTRLLNWPFLQLPRVSSKSKLEDICRFSIPRDGNKTFKRLCIILIARANPSSDRIRQKMLEFIELNKLNQDEKTVFAYVDPDRQKEFVKNVISETDAICPLAFKTSTEGAIILLEQHPGDSRKATMDWLSYRWDPMQPDELDRAKISLYEFVRAYKHGEYEPKYKVVLPDLIDEEGPSLINRIFGRFFDYVASLFYHLTSQESFATLVILVGCACLTSLFLYKGPDVIPSSNRHMTTCGKDESNNSWGEAGGRPGQYRQQAPVNRSENEDNTIAQRQASGVKLIELKAETYNGMIRLLKPGNRSIVVLVDEDTREKLLVQFTKAVWPYRKNKTLLFGYLSLDKNLDWYRSLLEQVLGCEGLTVNKKNCIGTVLSLNGFKKYLRVYHVKHHEIDYYDDNTRNDGSFLGFDDNDDADASDDSNQCCRDVESNAFNHVGRKEICTVDHLLDRLPIWLDKMFDGLTKRYFVENWPDNIE